MNRTDKIVDVLLLTETNFILDITFEQSQQCERLFSLALNSGIPVVIPEYSFAEAEGNIGNNDTHYNITVDKTPPSIILINPQNNTWSLTDVMFYYNVSDIHSKIDQCSLLVSDVPLLTNTTINESITQN